MWYYLEEDQQRGPVMDADLEALRRDGKINSETLVWREGMANWQPFREVQPAAGGQTSAVGAPPVIASTLGAGQVVCSQCGGVYPASEVIRYGSAAVCAACKPIFVQKLKEGANLAGGLVFAGFWTRFAAYFVDGIILFLVGMVVQWMVVFAVSAIMAASLQRGSVLLFLPIFLSIGVGLVLRAAYFIYFTGKDGQTPGKKLCHIRVVCADGSPVSYGLATGRFFGYMLSGLILGIGFLMVAWDDEKRGLHDRLCDTRVIQV